jgi:hypothetical protein
MYTQPTFEFTNDYLTSIPQKLSYVQIIDPKATTLVPNQYNQELFNNQSGSIITSSIPNTTTTNNVRVSTLATPTTTPSGMTGSTTRNDDKNRTNNTYTPKSLPSNNIDVATLKPSVHNFGDGNKRSMFNDQKRAREREDERNGDCKYIIKKNMDDQTSINVSLLTCILTIFFSFLTMRRAAALNKLINFISAIFESEDSLPLTDSSTTLTSPTFWSETHFFIPSSLSSQEPLLTTEVTHKLIKLVNKVRKYHRLEDVEVEDLSRMLKILERAIREVETLDVFNSVRSVGTGKQENGRTKEEYDNEDEDMKAQKVEDRIDKIMNGIEAAIAAFVIMTGGKLSKQVG